MTDQLYWGFLALGILLLDIANSLRKIVRTLIPTPSAFDTFPRK